MTNNLKAAMQRIDEAGKALAEEKRAAAQVAAQEESRLRQLNPEPGDLVEGQGIYIGTWGDEFGGIKKTFNVYAAPENLPALYTYEDAVRTVSKLQNWNGYDGTKFSDDLKFYKALKKGTYRGGWIIPPLSVLRGELGLTKSFYGLRHVGGFQGNLERFPYDTVSIERPNFYWSSSTTKGWMWGYSSCTANEICWEKNKELLSVRPIRMVEIKR